MSSETVPSQQELTARRPNRPKEALPIAILAILVFAMSLVMAPFYTEGDQAIYNKIWMGLKSRELVQAYVTYTLQVGSQELVHFLYSYVLSNLEVEKYVAMASANVALAWVVYLVFRRWGANRLMALMIVVLNFYMMVLYLAAERLKFGFILLGLSILLQNRTRWFFTTVALAAVAHFQTLIAYISVVAMNSAPYFKDFFQRGMVRRSHLLVTVLAAVVALFLYGPISSKIASYLATRDISELTRIGAFFLLSLITTREKTSVLLFFIPLMAVVAIVGGDRVNLFGYFGLLYFSLWKRGGFNFAVVVTSGYFAYASLGFLNNVFLYGDGFH